MTVYQSIYQGPEVDASVGRSYVPTLNAAPTSSTLTFSLDGNTVDYAIGQMCRVADQTEETGYKFYQLYDITGSGNNKVAHWQAVGSGGGSSTDALNVEVTMSDNDDTDLAEVAITIAINGGSPIPVTGIVDTVTHKKTFTAQLEFGDTYVVAFGDVERYRKPSNISGTKSNTSVTLTAEYEAYLVNLGLPSGKKWAIGNLVKDSNGNYSIGAETDWGTYISWGNIIGHNEGEGYNFDQTTYNSTAGASVSADIPSNDSAHDICVSKLGSAWHLPTKADFQELYDNTDTEWTTINGVNGRKFMKKSDHSVYVFFPASGIYNGTSLNNRGSYGDYWSASFSSSTDAYLLNFNSSSVRPQNSSYRRLGFSVRAVQ